MKYWDGKYSVASGATIILAPAGSPWSLSILPISGAAVTVSLTTTPVDQIGDDGSGATWQQLGSAITANTMIAYPAPVTAIKVTSASNASTVELKS